MDLVSVLIAVYMGRWHSTKNVGKNRVNQPIGGKKTVLVKNYILTYWVFYWKGKALFLKTNVYSSWSEKFSMFSLNFRLKGSIQRGSEHVTSLETLLLKGYLSLHYTDQYGLSTKNCVKCKVYDQEVLFNFIKWVYNENWTRLLGHTQGIHYTAKHSIQNHVQL